jgi:uncharacterized protein
MKSILIISACLLFTISSIGQTINPNLDSTLAKSLGADDYGMKKYVLVILKTGSNTNAKKATSDSLFAGHLNNINRLTDLKKLIVAGPFAKNGNNFRGIFILDVISLEEAKKLLETDPAIKEKLLEPELYHWYGSAALFEYLKTHDKIWKYNF